MIDFEKLFNENREFIFKYLMKMTRNVSLSEELTQETFFRAYMNYASLRNKEKASVWLCQIAKNTYFAWYNEQKKKDSLDELETANNEESIEEVFVKKDLSQKALVCLHDLEEPYKEVFMLSVFGSFSLKDISEIFRKSESWARVTFYRAKQKLLERMRERYEL
ncbi:MAG: RNA polymerase sigma factor [Clostridia bacterium]|nr:RNA polymerase sigma factor [Clostridia bacterium]